MGFDSPTSIWQEIERSESYLVSSMFEEASSIASSIVKHLISSKIEDFDDNGDYIDMLESASMVLIQSLHQQHKSSQILNELKQLFTSVEFIPVRLLLTGACLQISSDAPFGLADILGEFLSKWKLVESDQRSYYAIANTEIDVKNHFVLEVDEYIEVVELYVMKLISSTLNDIDRAISWVEKAQLPNDARQLLLRRLHSLHSAKATKPLSVDNNELPKSTSDGSLKDNAMSGETKAKQEAILRLSKKVEPHFWWFRTINLRFGDSRVAVSNGKVVIGCLVLMLYWILRRKRISIKRIVERQALNLKKAVVDLWQLAFSYQVNPLAAVQPPTRR